MDNWRGLVPVTLSTARVSLSQTEDLYPNPGSCTHAATGCFTGDISTQLGLHSWPFQPSFSLETPQAKLWHTNCGIPTHFKACSGLSTNSGVRSAETALMSATHREAVTACPSASYPNKIKEQTRGCGSGPSTSNSELL